MSKVQHMMGWKTSCNQSRPDFLVFQFFNKPCNWQPKIFRICATATGGPVFCSWVQFDFGLFSSPVNWTCEHYLRASLTMRRSSRSVVFFGQPDQGRFSIDLFLWNLSQMPCAKPASFLDVCTSEDSSNKLIFRCLIMLDSWGLWKYHKL